METTTITMIAILVVIALLLVWLSLSMAATEGAVGRVTRASLNNLILEIQTDTEASQFIRDKKNQTHPQGAAADRRPLRDRRFMRVLPHHLQCA